MSDEFAPTEIPRDRYGRPMVMPPGGKGKRIPYRRTTTFSSCLEDSFGLTQWKLRQAVIGMGQRSDLVLAAAAADPTDKNRLDEIVSKAVEHSTAAATTGTSLHSLTERLDRGQKLGVVPEPYGADLKAYELATAGIEWTDIECFRKGLLELLDTANGIAPTLIDLAAAADSVEQLRALWRKAKQDNALTEEFLAICEVRHRQLTAAP